MSAKIGPTRLPFIVSTDRKQVDAETRKFIRSHVMRGKNRIKTRRKTQNMSPEDKLKRQSLTVDSPALALSIPRLLCSMFSAVCFADVVEPALIADVLSFSSISSEAMFTLNESISPQTSATMQAWFTPLLFDAAYLNAVCFTIQAYFDGIFERTRSDEAQQRDRMYYAKTVRILQERLAFGDDSVRLSDSTAMTVLVLYGHAYTNGDYETADNHSKGLLKLVSMRGVDSFLWNTRLSIEIIRCDLAMAVDTCSRPTFFASDNIPWSLTPSTNSAAMSGLPKFPKRLGAEEIRPQDKLDLELADICTVMLHFCSVVNAAAEGQGDKITEETFLHNMGSIMYRLLHQQFMAGSLNEAFRLGLLAFSSPIFLNWNRVELLDRRFTSSFRDTLAKVHQSGADAEPQEFVWLLMIGALSMAQEGPDSMVQLTAWLREYTEICDIRTWDDMRSLLSSFLWIGSVYDCRGQVLFESVLP